MYLKRNRRNEIDKGDAKCSHGCCFREHTLNCVRQEALRAGSTSSPSSSPPRGCQDARELLRFEAVVLEKLLHHTLIEAKETHEQLEEKRVQATAR